MFETGLHRRVVQDLEEMIGRRRVLDQRLHVSSRVGIAFEAGSADGHGTQIRRWIWDRLVDMVSDVREGPLICLAIDVLIPQSNNSRISRSVCLSLMSGQPQQPGRFAGR